MTSKSNVLTPAEVAETQSDFARGGRLTALCDSHEALRAKVEKSERAYYTTANDIEQSLGNALGYPKYRDDPENFPEATDDSVCVGDHVPESLASEAAAKITSQNATITRLRGLIEGMTCELSCCSWSGDDPCNCIRSKVNL